MTDTTVVIKTLGRPTLKAAMRSAKREGFKTIVVSDGARVSAQGAYKYIRLGKQWGYYGGMAANVGAAVAETEFITFLDDDDEFAPGAGEIIRSKLKERPEIDVWIGGVRFCTEINIADAKGETVLTSRDLSLNSNLGVVPGNVCMPTYRTSVFSKIPFSDTVPADEVNLADFYHIQACGLAGFKIDWFGSVIYLVRPIVGGVNGAGQ